MSLEEAIGEALAGEDAPPAGAGPTPVPAARRGPPGRRRPA